MRRLLSVAQKRRFSSRRLAPLDSFPRRHVGVTEDEIPAMLSSIGSTSVDELIHKTIPTSIHTGRALRVPESLGESATLKELREMMSKNHVNRSHIGMGYYNTIIPPVVLRNMLENPGWYTPYTPYQAEISQGRLEMLLNFQTMVSDLTGLPVANCSLLDEATAASEAVNMCWASGKKKHNVFYVSDRCHPQTIDVVITRCSPLGVDVRVVPESDMDFSADNVCGILVQYPDTFGSVKNYEALAADAHKAGAQVVAATDLLAATVLKPPGDWGADICIGSAQRFGVPMGFGGPHAGFISVKEKYKRKLPGRLIGVSKDSRGLPAYRMALQTREQHIRRDKATSNICTAQALLANISAAYAIYHGPEGLKDIATRVHTAAAAFSTAVQQLGYGIKNKDFFDTVHVDLSQSTRSVSDVRHAAEELGINLRFVDRDSLTVSFDETTLESHIADLLSCFAVDDETVDLSALTEALPAYSFREGLWRSSSFLTHPTFNLYHSETEMLRYLSKLERRDLGLNTAMIPLGSCTMKLNATSEMIPVTWTEVSDLHPFAPEGQWEGYREMMSTLEEWLCDMTGFYAICFQPNSGSQGEYTGLQCISSYHKSKGEGDRNVCLIPTSAHGTNPASAVFAGMKVVPVKCDAHGNVDLKDLQAKAQKHSKKLAAFMVTYPSTHGVFEEGIKEAINVIHDNGGLVYMDGANMNAQVGFCSPGDMGADVCHLNLHKTFAIPHGGGGPGMGPIGVTAALTPFLPNHPVVKTGGEHAFGSVAAAPFSSASILPITWMYVKLLGGSGLKKSTETAILSANYIASRLKHDFDILYTGSNGTCGHEFILDLRPFKSVTGVVEEDVAKRLMDFNFHAPTMSFPVAGTLMIEPTESESKAELDRLCDALLCIRQEIRDIEDGRVSKDDNPLKNAPHTADMTNADDWSHPYSRQQAAYPLPYLKSNKFWPYVGRIDNVFGDRNVVCTCPSMSDYEDVE